MAFIHIWQYFCKIILNKKKVMEQDMNDNQIINEEMQSSEAQTNETLVEKSLEEQLQDALTVEKDKFLRLFAEFENYKKRTIKERAELFKTANQEVLQAILPIMDDFDRAWTEISKSEDENLVRGISLIHEKLKSTLASKGLEVVELKAGDVFNADFAEAITQIPAPTKELKGKIVDVIEKGYKLGDRIIRFPKVIIGQ